MMPSTQTASKPAPPADALRTRQLGAIHAAKRQLALTDDSYRAIIGRFSKQRTESAADLTPNERTEVIEYFRRVGFKRAKPARKPGNGTSRGAAKGADMRPQAMKLKALWRSLYELGIVRDPSHEAMAVFVCRHTNIAVLQWNRPIHLATAIASMFPASRC